MYYRDTIAAIATPVGSGGIGIIRLSGPDALTIIAGFFRSASFSPRTPQPCRLHVGTLFDPDDGCDLDEALVSYMKAPRSYTGEDVVEINCHSGIILLEKILRLTLAGGARLAEPGEFTRRAFLNGRMDLTRAEAVIDIIEAKSEQGLKIASRQLTGLLAQRVTDMHRSLLDITATVEAAIDFPEDALMLDAAEALSAQARGISDTAGKLCATFAEGCLYKNGVCAVIAGKPNVGKSSLLNALLGDDRAIVTAIPGTTRDVLQEIITINGIPVRLTDTAGVHESNHAIERLGIERARAKIAEADLVLLVLDAGRPLDEADRSITALLENKHVITVINKIDTPRAWKEEDLAGFFKSECTVVVSALHHTGLDSLKKAVAGIIGTHPGISPSDILIANARHRQALEKTSIALAQASHELRQGSAPELIAVDLHAALDALSEITGPTTADDILDHIFSRFCIGK